MKRLYCSRKQLIKHRLGILLSLMIYLTSPSAAYSSVILADSNPHASQGAMVAAHHYGVSLLQASSTSSQGGFNAAIFPVNITQSLPAEHRWIVLLILGLSVLLLLLYKGRLREVISQHKELQSLVAQEGLSLQKQNTLLANKSLLLQKQSPSLEMATQENKDRIQRLTRNQDQLATSAKLVVLSRISTEDYSEVNSSLKTIKEAMHKLLQENQSINELEHCDFSAASSLNHQEILESVSLLSKDIDSALDIVSRCHGPINAQAPNAIHVVALTDYIQRLVSIVKYQNNDFTGRIDVLAETEVQLEVDVDALESILTSLIDNAIQHAFPSVTEQARILITISIDSYFKANTLLIKVTDNGCGIDANILPLVFAPLYSTAVGKGSRGMGLYLASNLATDVLACRLECQSIAGAGSEFILSLPIDKQQVTMVVPKTASTKTL